MHNIKAFVNIESQINNTKNVNSTLGELSTWSRTYSRNINEYSVNSLPNYNLIVFSSVENSQHKILDGTTVTKALQIIHTAVSYSLANIRPLNPTDFRNTILANYSNDISSFTFGAFIDNGDISLPEWVSWSFINSSGLPVKEIKIWLSDEAFANQYDQYEIVVVPPITPVDSFFNLFHSTTAILAQKSLQDINDELQVEKNNQPETYLRFFNFDFINQVDQNQKFTTTWGVLIYGKAGDNIDAVKDAITAYILANSSRSESDWIPLLPDLFKRTEFIFIPRWDKVAIPNLTNMSELYSSYILLNENLTFIKSILNNYTSNYLNSNTYVIPHDYKAISLLAVNGNQNITGKTKLHLYHPDYIPVNSTSLDFNRMTVKTQNFYLLLSELIMAAEIATEFNSIPQKLRRVKRNGKLFISAVMDNVNYLVAAKSNTFYN